MIEHFSPPAGPHPEPDPDPPEPRRASFGFGDDRPWRLFALLHPPLRGRGRTDTPNLVALCSKHHRLHHRGRQE
jgi:hypothetical protein